MMHIGFQKPKPEKNPKSKIINKKSKNNFFISLVIND